MKEETELVLNILENIVESATEPRIFLGDKEQLGRVTDQVISIFETEKMTYADTYATYLSCPIFSASCRDLPCKRHPFSG